MNTLELIYKTANGNQYPLEFFIHAGTINQLDYEPDRVRDWCRGGCKNFGISGGCPPLAPLLYKHIRLNNMWLIVCKFESKHKPEKVKNSRNTAIHWKFQDAIVARILNNLGQSILRQYSGNFLATGYCMGCPGKKCSFKLNENICRNPSKRTFSMEATGVNVVKTVKNIFDLDFYWYRKGIFDVPYLLKCMAYFTNNPQVNVNSLINVLKDLPNLEMKF